MRPARQQAKRRSVKKAMRRITAAALGFAMAALAALAATCGQKGPLTPPAQDALAGTAAVATHALRP